MRGIWPCIRIQDFFTIELKEQIRLCIEKGPAKHHLRRIGVLLAIQTVYTAEVRQPALGRYTGTAEKYNPAGDVDHQLQLVDLVETVHLHHRLKSV